MQETRELMTAESCPLPRSTSTYPGQVLGIVGFALAFVIQPIGLVISIIALIISRRKGKWNPFAIAGIITSIAMFVIGWLVFFTIALFFTTLPALDPVTG
jgi:hypothetical protein